MLKVYDLRTEYRNNPIGLDAVAPRLSWKLDSDKQNVMQTAYRVVASSNLEFSNILWDSGRVESDQSQCVNYAGKTLNSSCDVWWKVQVWTESQDAESDTAYFKMGLLKADDWKANWIEPEGELDYDAYHPAPYLRKSFVVRKGFKRAHIYHTAKGVYQFWFNGTAGTEDMFNPGLTSYYTRLQYQVYDVSAHITEGQNVWSVALGDGWWRGNGTRNNYGYRVNYIGQLLIEYNDGSTELIITDESFLTSTGGMLRADMKDGELYDARLEPEGWKLSGFDDSTWKPVHTTSPGTETLIASRSVPMRAIEEFEGKVITTPNGELVIDFGQNIAGFVRMKLRGCYEGQQITLTHGETLDHDGNFTLSNMTGSDFTTDLFQQQVYIAQGPEEVTHAPLFMISGFRYLRVAGYKGNVLPGDFVSVAVYSALDETGDFTCSHPLINKLVKNAMWSQKGNYLDVPTDCPTRERGAYGGDAQVYLRTASLFMNVYPFFEKWMLDLIPEQFESGKIGCLFPNTFTINNPVEYRRIEEKLGDNRNPFSHSMPNIADDGEGCLMDGSAGWGDAATLNPYNLYLCYGDTQILHNQYNSAKKWVDYMDNKAKVKNPLNASEPYYHNETYGECDGRYVWDTYFHWGEWLEADGGEIINGRPFMPFFGWEKGNALVATAYYAHSAGLLSKMAEVLGKTEDAEKYGTLSKRIKDIYSRYFVKDNGEIRKGRQAPSVRVLAFDLCTDAQRQAVADNLAAMIKEQGYLLNTGFLSTPYILQVLTENGHKDVAFKLLEQEDSPSWLRSVILGATTIPESWDGIENLRSSFNHYSYGAVCDFLFSEVAGIQPDINEPGYKHFIIKPTIGGTLTNASAKYKSIYGTIYSAWSMTDKGVEYSFRIPCNTTATVVLPSSKATAELIVEKFPSAQWDKGEVSFSVGSGNYVVQIVD